jgi:hypothetical protein
MALAMPIGKQEDENAPVGRNKPEVWGEVVAPRRRVIREHGRFGTPEGVP